VVVALLVVDLVPLVIVLAAVVPVAAVAADMKADKEAVLVLGRVVFKPQLLARLSVMVVVEVAENIIQDHPAELMVVVVVEEVHQVVVQQIGAAAVEAVEETVTIKHGLEVLEEVPGL
jgi:hypothetical protein